MSSKIAETIYANIQLFSKMGSNFQKITYRTMNKLTDALPADIRESGHGQQSVAPLAALAPQLPAHRAGLSPTAPRGHNRPGAAVPARASVPRIRVH